MARRIHDHSATRVRVHGNCEHPYEPDEPSGYLAWHEWAEEHDKTHVHEQCPDCGLWVICKPRTEATLPVCTDLHTRLTHRGQSDD